MHLTIVKFFPSLLLLLMLAACAPGGSGSSPDQNGSATGETNTTTELPDDGAEDANESTVEYPIRVERGNLLGGTVKDAVGQIALQKDPAVPVYYFSKPPVLPVTVTGGWIDMDRDGVKNGFDFDFPGELHSCNSLVITPLTSLVPKTCSLADVQGTYNAYKGIVENDLVLSEPAFFSETISSMNDPDFTLFSNAVYRAEAKGYLTYTYINNEYQRLKRKADELQAAFPESNLTVLIEIESTKDLQGVEPAPDALRSLYQKLENENCAENEVLVPVEHMAGYNASEINTVFSLQKSTNILFYSECLTVECENGYVAQQKSCVVDEDACKWQPISPVCGNKNGIAKSYDKQCLLEADGALLLYEHACVTCQAGYELDLDTFSCVAVEQPDVCTAVYDPVCGEKAGVRKTYSNQCELDKAGATKLLDDACGALTCPAGETLNAQFFCEPVEEPIECDAMHELVGNECVLKTCPVGYDLQHDGTCACANPDPVWAVDADSCQQFNDECSVPAGWTIVDECPVPDLTYNVTDNAVDVVNAHNYYRAQVFEGYLLSWDNTLQQDAQDWADYLAANYTDADRAAGIPPHASMFEPELHEYDKFQGENIYMTTAYPNQVAIVTAVEAFADEKQYYHDSDDGGVCEPGKVCGTCDPGQICGHYTQVVWKNTSIVGCAEAQMQNNTFNTVIVCRYYYPGNWIGEWPY